MQLLRSTFLLVATGCFFAGLKYLPLAEASAITFLAPIFIVLLSQPLLKEKLTRARWIAAITGIAHWLLIAAFMMAPASLLTPFTYLQMVWATLLGYMVFGQLPDR